MPRSPRTGALGEAVLRAWAAEAGLAANASSEDQAGWDFLLDWPYDEHVSEIPFDKQPTPLQCLVQVKASTAQSPRWNVKLTNWARFVNCPLPCFFLLLRFDSALKCVAGSLVHIDEPWIERVLARLRSFDPASRPALHKHYIPLTLSSGTSLSTLSGRALEQALCECVPGGLKAYAKNKIETVGKAGYTKGAAATMNVRFNLPAGASVEDVLVDFSLGLVSELELESGEVRDTRFGVPAPVPDHVIPKGAKLGLAKNEPHGNGKVTLRLMPAGTPLVLAADVFLPSAVAHVIPESHLKVRFALRFVDISWKPFGAGMFNITPRFPPPDARHSLSDLADTARLLNLLGEAGRRDAGIDVTLTIKDEHIASGVLSNLSALPAPVREWSALVAAAMKLAETNGVASQVETTVNELADQKNQLQFISGVVDDRSFRLTTYFDESPKAPDLPWWLPGAIEVAMGDFVFQVCCAIELVPTATSDAAGRYRYEFESKSATVLNTSVFLAKDSRPSIESLINDVTARYDHENVLRLADFFY